MSDEQPAEDMWLEFLGPDKPFAWGGLPPMKNCHCGICGNRGIIDTRGKVFTPAGMECGVRRYCICPNGRAMMRSTGGMQLRDPL